MWEVIPSEGRAVYDADQFEGGFMAQDGEVVPITRRNTIQVPVDLEYWELRSMVVRCVMSAATITPGGRAGTPSWGREDVERAFLIQDLETYAVLTSPYTFFSETARKPFLDRVCLSSLVPDGMEVYVAHPTYVGRIVRRENKYGVLTFSPTAVLAVISQDSVDVADRNARSPGINAVTEVMENHV